MGWGGKRTLTVPEAAEALGVTERAIWHRIYRGQLPHKRWGKKVLILADELEAFVNALPGISAQAAVARAAEDGESVQVGWRLRDNGKVSSSD